MSLQVPPIEYFKHVILELKNDGGGGGSKAPKQQQHLPPSTSAYAAGVGAGTVVTGSKYSVRGLQKRFDEVSSCYPTMQVRLFPIN